MAQGEHRLLRDTGPSPYVHVPVKTGVLGQDVDGRTGLYVGEGDAVYEPWSGLLVDGSKPGAYDGNRPGGPGFAGVIDQPVVGESEEPRYWHEIRDAAVE